MVDPDARGRRHVPAHIVDAAGDEDIAVEYPRVSVSRSACAGAGINARSPKTIFKVIAAQEGATRASLCGRGVTVARGPQNRIASVAAVADTCAIGLNARSVVLILEDDKLSGRGG